MSELTPGETARTRRLLAAVALMALILSGLAALQTACGKRPGNAAAPKQAVVPPIPTPTPDPGEAPSFRRSAAPGEASFDAVHSPFEADLDDQGRIWILDSAGSRIRLFDATGGFLGGWGGKGDGQTSFRNPEGLAISGNDLYVADTWNHRVVRSGSTGEWKGSVTGFMGPRGVAVAPDGSVWVTDTGNSRVVKYDAALENPQTVGPTGEDPGQFRSPVGIAIGPSGSVYIADAGNSRIQILNKDGTYASSWSVPWLKQSWQARLETDKNGTLYASNPGAAEVVSFDRSGAPDRHWTADDSGERFLLPVGLAIDRKQGILYVMDDGSHKVLKISLSARKAGEP